MVSSALGKDGRQRDGDGADVHEEEQSVEKSRHQPPVARHAVLPLGVVQPAQVDPQVAIDVADVAFETSAADRPQPGVACAQHGGGATVQRAAVVEPDATL